MAFCIPALGIYVCAPLLSLIDAAFVGSQNGALLELAALGPASSIADSAHLPLLFLSIAATNLVASASPQALPATASRVTRASLAVGTAVSTVGAVLLYTAAPKLAALYCGTKGAALVPACATYVAIRATALPAVVITTIAQAICLGVKDSRTPLYAVALAAVANFVGDLVWVPRYGMAGAAAATALSQGLSAALLLRVLQKRGFLRPHVANANVPRRHTLRQLVAFVPFLFVTAVKMLWHNSNSATAASLGGVPAAAHTAVLSVAMLGMVLGDVGSTLSQAFLPAFGTTRNNKTTFDLKAALPTIRQLLKCTLSISTTVVIMAALLIGGWGSRLASDPNVVMEMRRILPWILATLSIHGSVVTLEGLLLSQQKFRGLTGLYSVLAVMTGAFSWATRTFGWGLEGVWGCYLSFCGFRFLSFLLLGGLIRPKKHS